MIKIRLFCAAGMSTSLLVAKMKEAAKKQGLEVDISASPVTALSSELSGVDVALLGPQIGYQLAKVQQTCTPLGIPVAVIKMTDYGMINGENVLNDALKLINK